MRIIIFMIGTRAGDPHRLGSDLQIANERPIEPFAAVVEIEAQNAKRQVFLNVFGLFQHSVRSLVPHCTAFSPTASQVRIGQAPDEIAGQTTAAVSHTISLQESQAPLVPHLALDGYLMAQQAARASAILATTGSGSTISQQPVQRRRTDGV